MPAIDPVRAPESSAREERIQELKLRAAQALDSALDVVDANLGRAEARQADRTLLGLDVARAEQEQPAHRLDAARVMDLIADPFEDD